jgi:hypothetical protein
MSKKEQKPFAKRLPSWEEVLRLMDAPSTSAPAPGLMSSAPSSIQSKPAPRRLAIVKPTEEPTEEPILDNEEPVGPSFPPANDDQLPSERLPLGNPASRAFGRFLITFCIGVAATLAWQSYGDTARGMIANASPQLSWLAPPAAPVAEASAAPSPEQEELKAISFGLADVRQRVDEIAAQLAAGQEQMTRDFANKMQAVEQDILDKVSAPPPRSAAPAKKSVPLTPLPLTPPEAQLAR